MTYEKFCLIAKLEKAMCCVVLEGYAIDFCGICLRYIHSVRRFILVGKPTLNLVKC